MSYRLCIVVVLIVMVAGVVIAQQEACPVAVQDAVSMAVDRCSEIGRNHLCYGHIEAQVEAWDDDIKFEVPGDIIPLEPISNLQLSAMQTPDRWGVAFMQLQANLPDTLPGQNVTVILFGDVALENKTHTLPVVNNTGMNVRGGPGTHYDVVLTLAANTELVAHGRNEAGDWLRVTLPNERPGWLWADLITVTGDPLLLPVVQTDTPIYGPMQAFYFRNGIGTSSCDEAPADGILVQSPTGDVGEILLEVNEVQIELGSTAFMQAFPDDAMTVAVIEGQGKVTARGLTVIVPAGARATIPLDEEGLPTGIPRVDLYDAEYVAKIPYDLIPERPEIVTTMQDTTPVIVGGQVCRVIADGNNHHCPLYFINADGDAITRLTGTFLYAPRGDWGDADKVPELYSGDYQVGAIAWGGYCTLGTTNFIGPVIYDVRITDAAGNVSEPYQAAFNCVAPQT